MDRTPHKKSTSTPVPSQQTTQEKQVTQGQQEKMF